MKPEELYAKVMAAIQAGYNVEIQKAPDGSLRIYRIKRNKIT